MSDKVNKRTGKITRAVSTGFAVILLLAGCQTGPMYQARDPGERFGYTDQQLSENRFRVTFSGSSASEREEVESYLLRRAAEVTVAHGYTHFVFDDRDTLARTHYRQTFSSFDPIVGPSHFPFRGWYWSTWPYNPPYGYGYGDLRPVTSYAAYAEIVGLTPSQVDNNPRAIDAEKLLQQLGPLHKSRTAMTQ